jgi:predicted RNase H-like nuclease (RuvC/YqgF family)
MGYDDNEIRCTQTDIVTSYEDYYCQEHRHLKTRLTSQVDAASQYPELDSDDARKSSSDAVHIQQLQATVEYLKFTVEELLSKLAQVKERAESAEKRNQDLEAQLKTGE